TYQSADAPSRKIIAPRKASLYRDCHLSSLDCEICNFQASHPFPWAAFGAEVDGPVAGSITRPPLRSVRIYGHISSLRQYRCASELAARSQACARLRATSWATNCRRCTEVQSGLLQRICPRELVRLFFAPASWLLPRLFGQDFAHRVANDLAHVGAQLTIVAINMIKAAIDFVEPAVHPVEPGVDLIKPLLGLFLE